jgi:AraC-like DNA-binding protein
MDWRGWRAQYGQVLAAWVKDPSGIRRLQAAYGDRCVIVQTAVALETQVAGANIRAVICELTEESGQATLAAIQRLRSLYPGLEVLVYASARAELLRLVFQSGAGGATGLILRDVDDDGASLQRYARAALDEQIISSAVALVRASQQTRLTPVIQYCLERVSERLTAPKIANEFGVHPRTLTNWAKQNGIAGVRSLLSRCRVVVAIGVRTQHDRISEEMALELGFHSAAHLANSVKRHAGLRMRDVLARGSFEDWCRFLLLRANQ